MSETTTQRQDVAKVYTATRRFPQLIGRTTDGKQIPGGPYTFTQFFGGFIILFVLWKSMALWTTGSRMQDWALVLLVTLGLVFLLGRMPLAGRSPFSVVAGYGSALSRQAPREVGGLTPGISKPHAVRGRLHVQSPDSPAVSDTGESTTRRRSRTAPADRVVDETDTPNDSDRADRTESGTTGTSEPIPADTEAVPSLVALDGGGGRTTTRRQPAAQTSVEALLEMARLPKEA